MNHQDNKSFQLFDLLAREWNVPSAIQGITFNNKDSLVAIASEDGKIFVMSTDDPESPNRRLHHAIDTAQRTISPRENDLPPLQKIDCLDKRSSPIISYGEEDFLFGTIDGQLITISPQGDATVLDAEREGPIHSLACKKDSEAISFASNDTVMIWNNTNKNSTHEIQLAGPVTAVRYSPDGSLLGIATETHITIWEIIDTPTKLNEYPLDQTPKDIYWSENGEWIASTLSMRGFVLINIQNEQIRQFADFPATVNAISFNASANAIAASGAFRAAAWSLNQLSSGIDNNGALNSGKPGLVLVDCVAASPNKNLLAVGYNSGLLSLTQIGNKEEMLLNQDNGISITALCWSANGNFLAVGKPNGNFALVEFPNAMFK